MLDKHPFLFVLLDLVLQPHHTNTYTHNLHTFLVVFLDFPVLDGIRGELKHVALKQRMLLVVMTIQK